MLRSSCPFPTHWRAVFTCSIMLTGSAPDDRELIASLLSILLKLSYNFPPRTSWIILWLPFLQGRELRVEITYYGFILQISSFLDTPATWTVPHSVCFSNPLVAPWCPQVNLYFRRETKKLYQHVLLRMPSQKDSHAAQGFTEKGQANQTGEAGGLPGGGDSWSQLCGMNKS